MSKQELDYISKGMASLCDALGNLGKARNSLENGKVEDKVRLGLQRMTAHLVEAVADAPDEFWAIMMADHIGVEELRRRLDKLAMELAA